ncbi:MAG TPA: response regulator [Baekduia sp.]|nr:response regulator [Baekduia sp.]
MTGPSVLLVEDSPEYFRLLELTLEGVELAPARSLGEAVALLRELRPDVVATDLNLPDAAGVDIVRRLVAAAPGVPVVALSGVVMDDTRREALAAGAVAAVEKGGELDGSLAAVLRDAAAARTGAGPHGLKPVRRGADHLCADADADA